MSAPALRSAGEPSLVGATFAPTSVAGRDRLAALGRLFFAIGLAGFGVLHLVAQDFVAGRAPPWPEAWPGRVAWAYGSGLLLIAAGAAIAIGRAARVAALAAGLVIFVWALLRHLPPTTASTLLSPQWTQAGKALVFSGGALAVAGSLPATDAAGRLSRWIEQRRAFLDLGRFTLGLFMLICGFQHFIYDEFVASLVPAWLPAAYSWTYATGLALIAGGVGLLVPRTARLAAALTALMIFSWVWLVHLPRIQSHGEWLSPFEALALSGLALLLWRTLPPRQRPPTGARSSERTREPLDKPGLGARALLAAALLVALGSTAADLRAQGDATAADPDAESLRLLWDTLDRHWNERDAERFGELFTGDGSFVFVDRGESLHGRAAIREHFAERFPRFRPGLRHVTLPRATHVVTPGVRAVDATVEILERTDAESGGPAVLRTFAVVAVLVRNDDDAWHIRVLRVFELPEPTLPTVARRTGRARRALHRAERRSDHAERRSRRRQHARIPSRRRRL